MKSTNKFMLIFSIMLLFCISLNVVNAYSVLVSNGTAIYNSNNGNNFYKIYDLPNNLWLEDIETSIDGKYIYGIVKNLSFSDVQYHNNSYLLKSNDSGKTYSYFRNNFLSTIDISENGQHIYLGTYENYIQIFRKSNDFGLTFQNISVITHPLDFGLRDVSCSDDGKYVLIATFNNLYYSSNNGSTFTRYTTGFTSGYLDSVSSKGTGQYMYAGTAYGTSGGIGGGILSSNNYGVSWVRNLSNGYSWSPLISYNSKSVVNGYYSFANISYYTTDKYNTYTSKSIKLTNLNQIKINEIDYFFNSINNSLFYITDFNNNNWTYYNNISSNIIDYSLSLYSSEYGLYTPNYQVTLSSINSYVSSNIIYIYPLYKESRVIKGYYVTYTDLENPYYAHICELNDSISLFDDFAYDNINNNGWVSSCNYTTQPFLENTFGLSLYLNNTACVSQLTKTIDISDSAEFSFIAKPISYNQPLGNLSSCFIIGLRSTANQDLTPMKLCYDYENSLLKVYGYIDSETLLFNIPYENTYVNITQYVNFNDKSYSVRLIDYDGNIYLSDKLDFYFNTPLDIGKIIISPIDDSSSSYIDNIIIKNVAEYPTLYLYNATLENETSIYGNYVVQDNCDYSVIKCYTSRFYLTSGEQKYNDFEDWNICSTYIDEYGVNTLTGVTSLDSDIGSELSSTTKALIVLFICFVVIAVCLGIGFSSNNAMIGLIIGGVASGFILIVAVLIGWLPVWIIVTMIVLSIAMAVLGSIFFNKSGGGNG